MITLADIQKADQNLTKLIDQFRAVGDLVATLQTIKEGVVGVADAEQKKAAAEKAADEADRKSVALSASIEEKLKELEFLTKKVEEAQKKLAEIRL